MYVFQLITHCFFVKLLFVLYFVSITTYEDVSDMAHTVDYAMLELGDEESNLRQKIILYSCPHHIENVDDLCVLFVHNTSYPPECPFEETVPFNTYIDKIRVHSRFPVWMPVRRDKTTNGIGLFYWMEPNSMYRSPFDPCRDHPCIFHNESNPSNNDCVVYHNSTNMEAVPCNQRATGVCAYDHLQKKKKSFCTQSLSTSCKQSDFSTKSKCFCMLPVTNLEKAEFIKPYQNLVYHSMTDEMCYIGLKNTGNSFIWTSSNLPVNYEYWAANTSPTTNKNTFGAISLDGWTLKETDRELNCTLYQLDIPKPSNVEDMCLSFEDSTKKFVLKLTNSTNWLQNNDSAVPLVFCFSDASAKSVLEKINIQYSDESGEFWFEPISEQTGKYWCEGFLYPELELKKSNEYQLTYSKEEYAVILNFTFLRGSDPLSHANLIHYKNLLDQALVQPTGSIFHTRISKIVRIDDKLSKISINYHITTDKSATEDTNLSVLRSILSNSSHDFTFINLLSVYFCIGLQVSHNGQSVTWLLTKIGEVAEHPWEGWCVDSGGNVLKRRCEGNFVDGAQWAEFTGICTIVSSTNTTVNLTSIVGSANPSKYLDQMAELTANYKDFGSSDVALVSDFLGQLASISTTNIQSVSSIVNNLGSISPSVLNESQTLNKILQDVDEIIRLSSNFDVILGKTLTIASFTDSSINTLVLMKDEDPIGIKFSRVSRPEDLAPGDHFDSALFLANTGSRSSERLKVSIYSTPVFFNSDNTRTIYRLLPTSSNKNIKSSIVYKNDFNSSSILFHRCSSWNETGDWEYQGMAEQFMDHIVCSFDSCAHSRLNSVQFDGETSITTELIRLKQFSSNLQQTKLTELRDLLAEFSFLFQPTDLYHISEILDQVQSVGQAEFHLVADIIDSISAMNRAVLSESQSQLNVPELLLTNLTRIMESYETSIVITRRNFFFFVMFINNTADIELAVNTCSEFCSVIVVANTRVSTKEEEISVFLPADLVKQLSTMNNSKLLLTVFNDDALFPFKDLHGRDGSKIIGVQFPGFDVAMKGAIRVQYHVNDAILDQHCGFWHGNEWEPEDATKKNGTIFSQCDYWKTGYFSLRFQTINITFFIEEQLKTDDTTLILKNIEELVIKYPDRFTAYDLALITKVFDRVGTVNESSLNIVSKIISVITKMNKVVLNESQENYQTTDIILDHLGKLAGMLESEETYYYYDTDLLLISASVKASSIIGVEMSNCEIECKVETLNGTVEESKVSDVTRITLGQELFRRLLATTPEPRLIITSFHNDALFNAKDSVGQHGIIFGIKIPGYDSLFENDIVLQLENSMEGYCVRWEQEAWKIEGKVNVLTCGFQQQGYLSYVNKDIAINVTEVLEKLLQSNSSDFDQLQDLKEISYLYDKFKPIDVSLLSELLMEIMDYDVNITRRIFQNMFSISKNIFAQSQIEHNALSNVLTVINSIGNNLTLNTSYTIENKFSLLACSAEDGISAVFDDDLNIWCTKNYDGDYFGRISLRPIEVSPDTDEKFIFTIFHDQTMFIQDETYNYSIILGFNDGSSQNGVLVEISKRKHSFEGYSCAYWEYTNSSYGVWWPSTTSIAGIPITCSFPQQGYFSLIKMEASKNITAILLQIDDSTCSYSEKLQHTLAIIDQHKDQFEALHISIISSIMERYDNVMTDLILIGDITSSLMDIDRNVLVQSQNLYNATNKIVYHIDTLITQHIREDTNLQFSNFAILILSNFSELSFRNCSPSCTIEINSKQLEDSRNMDALLSIDEGLKDYLVEHSLKLYITIYFKDVLFNEGCTDSTKNVDIVVGVTIPGMDDSSWKGSVRFGFKYRPEKADICAYWNWNYKAVNGSLIQKGHWEITPAHLDSMWLCPSRLESTHFAVKEIEKNVTSDLESILKSNVPIEEQLESVEVIITTETETLSSMDIFLIAQILGKLAGYQETTHDHVLHTSEIISSLFRVNRSTLRESQEMYLATDTILYNLDQIILKCQAVESVSDVITEDNFTVMSYSLRDTDIKGFRLEGCNSTSCDLTILRKNMDIADTIDNENLNTAMVLSDDLLQQIEDSNNPVYLVVTVFFHDVLFNEKLGSNYSTSIICGVLLKGLTEPMRGNLSLIYKANNGEPYDTASCAYWDYKFQDQEGSWKEDVVPRNERQAMICDYPHITHFVLLLANSEGILLDLNQIETLDIITNINSILSLFGLFGILLTALMFDRWRNNTGNQILIHFSFAISIKNVMLYISVGVWDESGGSSMACTITGGILHYSILSEFGWMLIIAILQFKRFVEVLGSPTKYILLKACICGWAFPVIPVFLIIIIDVNNYAAGQLGLCYPSGLGLYLGIWLPLLVIISINTVIFVVIIYNVFHKKTESRDQVNHEILFQWRLALLLFFMLGLTWLFGFLSLSDEYFFKIMFCFFATLQGFVMFMFFIVFNKSTRFLYVQTFRLWLYSNGYRNKFM